MTASSDVIGMQDLLKGDSMEEAKLADRYTETVICSELCMFFESQSLDNVFSAWL